MSGEEEYELIPHKEILELKKELNELKTAPKGGKTLQSSMDNLSTTMGGMLDLFKDAAESMEEEEGGTEGHEGINDKLDALLDQSKTIAEGLVAIADLMKEIKEKMGGEIPHAMPSPPPRPPTPFGMPSINQGPMPPPTGAPRPGLGLQEPGEEPDSESPMPPPSPIPTTRI